MKLIQKQWFLIVSIVIILLRFGHFENTIDEPHSWRQYDTQQYIDGYFDDNNKFLEPSVCWMGNHETLLLEFPLPEFLIAKCYSVFGDEIWVGRLFILICFSFVAYFLFKTLKLVFENRIPEIATICYLLTPLSIYYSRAIHIDFFALVFVFGMLYYCIKAIKNKENKHLFYAFIFACFALLEKAPYAFYFAIPIVVFAIHEKKTLWFLKRAIIFIIPVILLVAWSKYSVRINSQIPNWDQIPNFNRFTTMWYWYFGNFEQRLNIDFWTIVLERLYSEILGYLGLIFGIIGILFYSKSTQYWWIISVLIGTVFYWVIFFNLNLNHNYYQLPFVFPLVVLMAMGIETVANYFREAKHSNVFKGVIIVLFAIQSILYSETNYYKRNEEFNKVAQLINQNTTKGDVIIVSYGGLTPQCPIILQPADRKGFSIPFKDLTPELIYSLYKDAGVRKIAIVFDGYFSGEFQTFFEAMDEKKGFEVDQKGKALYICTLKFNH